jgi:hypothetical protein
MRESGFAVQLRETHLTPLAWLPLPRLGRGEPNVVLDFLSPLPFRLSPLGPQFTYTNSFVLNNE